MLQPAASSASLLVRPGHTGTGGGLDGIFARMQSNNSQSARVDDPDEDDSGRGGLFSGPTSSSVWQKGGRR